MATTTPATAPGKNDARTIFGWCMYDWANSAYVTTVTVGLLPAYFAREVVGPEGVTIGGTTYSATFLWGLIVGAAALVVFLSAPVLGSIADFSSAKKRFLLSFAYTGSLFTLLLYFCRSGDVYKTLLFFLVAQVGFVGANVFYDAFLPQIASEDRMDWISGKGYSYGYVGGGLQFAVALGLVAGLIIQAGLGPVAIERYLMLTSRGQYGSESINIFRYGLRELLMSGIVAAKRSA